MSTSRSHQQPQSWAKKLLPQDANTVYSVAHVDAQADVTQVHSVLGAAAPSLFEEGELKTTDEEQELALLELEYNELLTRKHQKEEYIATLNEYNRIKVSGV
jgi:hypothetical protein